MALDSCANFFYSARHYGELSIAEFVLPYRRIAILAAAPSFNLVGFDCLFPSWTTFNFRFPHLDDPPPLSNSSKSLRTPPVINPARQLFIIMKSCYQQKLIWINVGPSSDSSFLGKVNESMITLDPTRWRPDLRWRWKRAVSSPGFVLARRNHGRSFSDLFYASCPNRDRLLDDDCQRHGG